MHKILKGVCFGYVRRSNMQICQLWGPVRFCSNSIVKPKTGIHNIPVETKTSFADQNPDVFGTLSKKKDINVLLEEMPKEQDDDVSFDIEDETGRNKSRNPDYYAKLIKKLLDEKRVVDAIDILEKKMLIEDHAKPNYYIYNLLIAGCAKVGYTTKAFQLYTKMKKRQINVTPATYTALFNACANSPFPEFGIEKANSLREHILEKRYEPNLINYHAMIKAYGRCGDVITAFCVVDEMIEKGFSLTAETMCFLLQACISDKEAGFRHALLTWRKMMVKKISPTIYAYNLLLRCVKECGLGDEIETHAVIEKIIGTPFNKIESKQQSKKLLTSESGNNSKGEYCESNIKKKSDEETVDITEIQNIPNLISKHPYLGNLISIREIKKPEERLILLGGFKGFLKSMEENNIKPDIKTYTELLDVIPSTCAAEELLLSMMKKSGAEIDIDFCNMLIKKRSMRSDYESAREVLILINSLYLTPDIITFGVLAIACKTKAEAESLIEEMKAMGYLLNAEILGAMLHQACWHHSFSYVMFVMKSTLHLGIKPNRQFLNHLDAFMERIKLWKKESKGKSGKTKRIPEFVKTDWYVQGSKMFLEYYKKWIKKIEPVNEDISPWAQFHTPRDPNARNDGNQNDNDAAVHKAKFKRRSSANNKAFDRRKN